MTETPMTITPHTCPECGGPVAQVLENAMVASCLLSAGAAGHYTWSDTCETMYASMEPIGDERGRTRVECDAGHGWWAWIDTEARTTPPEDLLPLTQTWFWPDGPDAAAMLGMWMSREMCQNLARACRAVVVTLEHVDAARAGHDEADASDRFERYAAALEALVSGKSPESGPG